MATGKVRIANMMSFVITIFVYIYPIIIPQIRDLGQLGIRGLGTSFAKP
jgi:hypothetical protein